MLDSCSTCRFFRKEDKEKNTPDSCIRNPPTPSIMSRQNPLTQQIETALIGLIPPSLEHGTCGEYRATVSVT